MVTDAQVRLLRQKRMESKTMEAAAAAAAMSVRSAQKWQGGPLPSERKRPRHWRTWPDAFAEVWDTEVVPLLRSDEKGVLQAGTLLEVLDEKHPGQFGIGQLRTLQRRMRDWRALHGPEKEVFFPQEHPPGREAQMDFTHATDLGVTIRGALLEHLLFEFVLSFSGWTWAEVAFGETFEALAAGVQSAVWELGGSPAVARTDNLSAATHELRLSGGRAFNRRWKALLDHYQMTPTRINPGKSHEDGVVEQKHNRSKSALAQALVLRGSSDFESLLGLPGIPAGGDRCPKPPRGRRAWRPRAPTSGRCRRQRWRATRSSWRVSRAGARSASLAVTTRCRPASSDTWSKRDSTPTRSRCITAASW